MSSNDIKVANDFDACLTTAVDRTSALDTRISERCMTPVLRVQITDNGATPAM